MGRDRRGNSGKLRDGIYQMIRPFRRKMKGDISVPSASGCASDDAVTDPSTAPTHTEPFGGHSLERNNQISSQMGLWERAAESLEPEDQKGLQSLVESKRKAPENQERPNLAVEVKATLESAQDLKNEQGEANWRPVVDRIIQGALAVKTLGDAAVKFDKSGYAALGWSVVSSGLQIASNAKGARGFVVSNSEVIAQLMARYSQYELYFRGPEGGEDFDRLLTNVYKALLRYMIALNDYLNPKVLDRIQHGLFEPEQQSIARIKKAIDTADDQVKPYIAIIKHKRNENHHQTLIKGLNLQKIPNPSQECLKSLSFREMYHRLNEIERAAEETCKWLSGHESYRKWAADDRGLLCIKGKPGSGKSTLLQNALDDAIVANVRDKPLQHSESFVASGEPARAQAEPGVVILSFFFHDRGSKLQKIPLGLFRSLLHQLLSHVPEAIPNALLTKFEIQKDTIGDPGKHWDWDLSELQDFFKLSLRKVLESHQVYLFIDALDEYGEDNANQLIKSFDSWIQGCPAQAQFRVCFTCRHYPPLDLPKKVVEIRLEEENKGDISAYVQDKLSAWSDNENLATMWVDITNRASGVFIWAHLIVPRVLKLEREGENWKKIKREIDNTPQELDDLYRGLMDNLMAKPNSVKLIKWICFAMEPLTLDELRWAMIVDPAYSDDPASLRHYENTEDFATDCDMMEKKLKALSCGLAEVAPSSRVVQFIHQTVKDFFIREGLSALMDSQDSAWDKTNETDLEVVAHEQLSRTCIRYLSAEELMQSKLSGHEMRSVFPLLGYATTWWIAHVQQSEKKVPQPNLLRYFGWPSEAIVQLWTKVAQTFGILSPELPREGTTILHIAARYRLMGLLEGILHGAKPIEVDIDVGDQTGTPLWWAADEGHEDVVRLLLKNGANVDGQSEWWSHAVYPSMSSQELGCVLIRQGARVDVHNGKGETALQAASCRGYEKIVQLLLQHKADVGAQGGMCGNALQSASFAGRKQVVQILLEEGADVNAEAGWWGCALIAAIAGGSKNEAVVEILLDKGADVNSQGREGTALGMASSRGQEGIVRILLKRGADVNARSECHNNWTALKLASTRRHNQIVQILLEYGAAEEM